MGGALFFLGLVLGATCGVLYMVYRQQRQSTEVRNTARPSELLRISQRGIGYPLLIEIEGTRYWSVSEIADSEHRSLLFAAARTLLAQIPREHLTTVAPPPPEEEVKPSPAPRQVGEPPATSPPAPKVPLVSASSRASSPLSALMIQEIDELFQAILRTIPDAPEAGLMSAADGSMLIKVGSQYYRTVDEIAHPQVRQALRQAIKQWEARL